MILKKLDNMLIIKIDKSELDYLVTSSLDSNLLENIKNNSNQEFNNIYLRLSRTVAEKVLDFLGNELARIGLHQNSEPNSIGIMIENIIDKFSREVYK
jgi:hypothetical protein